MVSSLKDVAPLVSSILRGLQGKSEPADTGAAEVGGSGDEGGSGDVDEDTNAVLDEQPICDGLVLLVEFVEPLVDLAEVVKDQGTLLQSQCANL